MRSVGLQRHAKMMTLATAVARCRSLGMRRQIGRMRNISFCLALALLLAAFPSPALASSSDWFETEGGASGWSPRVTPDETGVLRALLEIDLKPGWKTYWRDPGDAGVPPTIDVSASTQHRSAEIRLPGARAP